MATATTKSVAEVSDIFDCSICLEKLKVPKYLPCLHTFCETCLQSYIESTADYTDQTQKTELWINCPLCRITVTSTDKNVTVGSWAKILPLNHLMLSLMDSNIQSCERKSKVCSSCEREGKSVIAKFWCKQCSDALCQQCKSFHGKLRPSMNHEVVSMENINELDISVPEIDEPCSFHRGKCFEVYCLDHRKLCCSVCFATQHRTCSDVLAIEEVSQRQGVKSGAETMMANLSKIDEIVDKAMEEKSDNIKTIQSELEAQLGDIATDIENIKHLLDTLYQSLKKNVKVAHDEQRSKLQAINEDLKCFKKTVSNDCKLLKAVITQGNAKQTFLTSESLRHQVMDQFSRIASLLETDKELHLKFTRNRTLESISDMQNLVDIDVIATDTKYHGEISAAIKQMDRKCLNSLSDGEKSESCDSMLLDDLFNWRVDRTLVINTQLAGEYSCDIYGGAILSDGKLVLTDRYNRKLKVYDTLGNLYTSFSMTSNPHDVTRSSEAQMFYVTHNDNTNNSCCVSLCKLTGVINIVSTFQAPGGVTGISYAGNVLLLGSGSHVYTVSSKDGTIIHKVAADISGKVKYVAASPKSDRFVHTDGDSIVCRTLQMKEIFRYRNTKLIEKPRGVAFDLQNNIYVCDYKSTKIIQIKQDGSEERILPISFKLVNSPYSVGFQPDGKTFFVGDYPNGYAEVHTLTRTTSNEETYCEL